MKNGTKMITSCSIRRAAPHNDYPCQDLRRGEGDFPAEYVLPSTSPEPYQNADSQCASYGGGCDLSGDHLETVLVNTAIQLRILLENVQSAMTKSASNHYSTSLNWLFEM